MPRVQKANESEPELSSKDDVKPLMGGSQLIPKKKHKIIKPKMMSNNADESPDEMTHVTNPTVSPTRKRKHTGSVFVKRMFKKGLKTHRKNLLCICVQPKQCAMPMDESTKNSCYIMGTHDGELSIPCTIIQLRSDPNIEEDEKKKEPAIKKRKSVTERKPKYQLW